MSKRAVNAKKIYNIVTTIIVALIFVFLVTVVAVMLVQKKNGGESRVFGYYTYDVLTDSMSGTIEKGDVILCKEVKDVNSLKEGDIITFTAPSGPLKGYNETHRIVKITRNEDGSIDYIETAGDKLYGDNIKMDEWHLSPENVKAIYVKKSVFIGGLRNFLSHWYGYVLLIVVPLGIVFALIIAGYVRDRVALEGNKNDEKLSLNDLSEEEKIKLLQSLDSKAFEDEKPFENTAENSFENAEESRENSDIEEGEGKASNDENCPEIDER